MREGCYACELLLVFFSYRQMLLGAIDRGDFSALSVSHVILENYIRREIGSLYFFSLSLQRVVPGTSRFSAIYRMERKFLVLQRYTHVVFRKLNVYSAFFCFSASQLSRVSLSFFRFLETDRVLLSGRCNFILSV